ncbi:MAG: hypothetical protein B7Y36_00430 [Novosphingobium sp. 28-62-57]|uniref:DUF1905 domain-containing protein n=1 Tax=unclassified Novosphingobium TaxID=2644732 RepID=UPI000BCCE43B|nr:MULTISPECIES: DUF1905 domain-containing protein [unclassified Novosphingobium]OYW48782.1 MAG: hypothetical protein B7Z34_11975 [Novosphingobium sp. 12-62-10]OYZ12062.1 MAG: hypothetical protein B7Y36_00430 [Novosphingobium sp. 28-62-57]OYZ98540.1 MAG: hypothetical protein B7X96_00825 [Novosphingobium sp. 17-62-8]HQS71497.1 DUF1905 domain-containing protein [Novosphingobium sp.]
MSDGAYDLTTTLWRWTGGTSGDWFFVTIDGAVGEALSATALMHRLETGRRAGWGSVKLGVQVGETVWRTSAFPSKEQGWIVPIKAAVRKAEGLVEGEAIALQLRF